MKNRPWLSVMGHTKLVAVIGIIASALILILMPTLKWVAEITLTVVLVHIAILLVLSLSVVVVLPEKIKIKLKGLFSKNKIDQKFDAGWSVGWMNGFWVVSVVFLVAAILIYVSFVNLQLLAFMLFLFAINFFVGNLIIRSPIHTSYLTLPWLNLFADGSTRILDAGCGAGRTTVAIGKIFSGRITAFDMFDSDYIDGGGNTLLEKNLKLVGLTEKVDIVQGDITRTGFQDETFDAVVSSYMIDHLGNQKLNAFIEINRILKPKGRMLMIVLTPGLTSFALLNVLSFMMTSTKQWRKLIADANFKLVEEGEVNGGTYFLIEKIKTK
jgi:ubiquinone/menaquinone biosynthesis C-methylase UbiE